jgi:hypothetical protein
MPRTIVSTLPDTPTTSTISSRAVSGSITTVNVEVTERLAPVTPPRRLGAEPTVIVVTLALIPVDRVVCWAREE